MLHIAIRLDRGANATDLAVALRTSLSDAHVFHKVMAHGANAALILAHALRDLDVATVRRLVEQIAYENENAALDAARTALDAADPDLDTARLLDAAAARGRALALTLGLAPAEGDAAAAAARAAASRCATAVAARAGHEDAAHAVGLEIELWFDQAVARLRAAQGRARSDDARWHDLARL